jgi:hypothetical protein
MGSDLSRNNCDAAKPRSPPLRGEVTGRGQTAELRLRGLEPPYAAIKQELSVRFVGIDEVAQKKVVREFAHQIGMFIRERDKPLR